MGVCLWPATRPCWCSNALSPACIHAASLRPYRPTTRRYIISTPYVGASCGRWRTSTARATSCCGTCHCPYLPPCRSERAAARGCSWRYRRDGEHRSQPHLVGRGGGTGVGARRGPVHLHLLRAVPV